MPGIKKNPVPVPPNSTQRGREGGGGEWGGVAGKGGKVKPKWGQGVVGGRNGLSRVGRGQVGEGKSKTKSKKGKGRERCLVLILSVIICLQNQT